ncbi:MAG: 16S rRNA (cytosine(1402)-N(4))-methyltransferase [Ignavibacteria bacterium CG2_30_36_16]|nr:16S rRNA (cytosine(1402)-N(4))-methyltransferase RsmH [Ignavibacteria bacterium]OIP60090.1 MAG: 16S rRNA (cytosine(1402)-N(4))-methyltransferase [Ignavibacteria bacterium CG2_30_36_16]PJB01133.1 MAG: 16S rRNA (cytosine(1402)-N(4))-methyltransferase RsmH [Ignavibacteria bacterium CG_4_9_14_3_um_filter_36_18]
MDNHHTPVLYNESLEYLITDLSGIYFDGTLGFGGHSSGILSKLNKNGLLIATDVDKDAFGYTKKKFEEDKRAKLYNFNFSQIDIMAKIESVEKFTGIFADLGVSSFQLDNPESGFTYRQDAKLDLRMDKTRVVSAADILNSFSEENVANIIFNYGEEKNSRQIARKICEYRGARQITTTGELVNIIKEITPQKYWNKTLSRVFQALRIYVNDELETLKNFLNKAVDLLDNNGRLVILTYHSLEDRIVKEKMKYEVLSCICPKEYPVCRCDKKQRLKILTKKPLLPSNEEIEINFRARSAKLRAAERV